MPPRAFGRACTQTHPAKNRAALDHARLIRIECKNKPYEEGVQRASQTDKNPVTKA